MLGGGVRPLSMIAAAGCLAVVASGCSSVKQNGNPNVIAGKQQFIAKCGSCHTLAQADTKGTVGPNLDEAFRASIDAGLERNAIAASSKVRSKTPIPKA